MKPTDLAISNPLTQPPSRWWCDVCHELIKEPRHGMLQWLSVPQPAHGFRIVHNFGVSPRKANGVGCYYDQNVHHFADMHLEEYLGPTGLVELLSHLDPGPYHLPVYEPEVADLREFVEIVRRLHVPLYEEARRYWDQAKEAGMFDDANEVWLYLPETSQEILRRFRETDHHAEV